MTSKPEIQHLSEDTLEQYCLGRLSQPEIEQVEDHLMVCTSCQDVYTETDDFVSAMRIATEELAAQPVVESWWTRWSRAFFTIPKPVFAAVACAFIALIVSIPRPTQTAVVDMQAMRGPETAVQAPADTELTLRLGLRGLQAEGSLKVQIVDADGKVVTRSPAAVNGQQAIAKTTELSPGTYWVRLYSGQELLREYGLNVR